MLPGPPSVRARVEFRESPLEPFPLVSKRLSRILQICASRAPAKICRKLHSGRLVPRAHVETSEKVQERANRVDDVFHSRPFVERGIELQRAG
jgi:hypothetical protein